MSSLVREFQKHQPKPSTRQNNQLILTTLLTSKLLILSAEVIDMNSTSYTSAGSGLSKFVATGSGLSKFIATHLHIGKFSFLLRSFNDGWTSISRMYTLSSISRLLTSTSIFWGICSAGQIYFRALLIIFKWPPVLALE